MYPVVDTLHGMQLTDNFRWLEDKTNQKVIDWTRAQHDYGAKYLEATQTLHKGLREEITSFIDLDFEGPYTKEGSRIFQVIKRKGDKQGKIFTLIKGEKLCIWDPVKLDSTGKTSTLGVQYTYDGERAAISAQKSGAEVSTTYIINTRTGKTMVPPIENTGGFSWTKDQQHAYITFRSTQDIKEQKPLKTYLLKIGDSPDKATFLGTTKDAKNSYYVYDNRYSDVSFYGESDFYTNTCKMRGTGSLEEGKLVYKSDKYKAYPEALDNLLYILTNDHASNFKLMVAEKSNPSFENWQDLIPEGSMVLQDYVVTKNSVIVQRKMDTQSKLTLFDLKGNKIKDLELPDVGSVDAISYKREEDSIYVQLTTFTSTAKIYVASPNDFKWRLFFHRELPVDMSNIVGEIKFYTSKDGTKVPAYVVHRKDMKLDGKNPVLLTAYGGFNSGISPYYYGYWAPFINRGGVVVEAGIRGGDEYGSADNEADFRWLLAYSPYHHVRYGVNLPTMLVTAGANDSRVDPMNAKKFVGAAQNNPGQINPIILHMDYDSGHGTGQSTKQLIDNILFSYEFILNQLGM